MKKVISLLLASAMIAGLTACGGSGSSSASSEPAAETAEGGEAAEGTEAAASGDAVEIKIWQPTDKESVENWWTEKIAAWNSEHPEIQVSREAIDRSDSYAYDNKVATAVTSNDLPDILFVDGPQVSYYAANGIIVPITDYFPDTSDFTPSTVAQCTYDGQLYAAEREPKEQEDNG